MSQKACLRLEPFEREYLKKYNILPHNHYKQLVAKGVPYKEVNAFIENRIKGILEEMAQKQKQVRDNEYLELAKENPFLVT